MGAKFMMGRATLHSGYVPAVGEVCRHEQPHGLPDRLVVGDGKTAAPELPSLQPLDLYARVQRLEQEPRRSQSLTTLLETIVNALMQQQFLPRWHKERLASTYKEFLNADAMLRKRERTTEESPDVQTNLDAVPAAIAPADSHAPRGAVDRKSVGTDKAEPLNRDCGTGNTNARLAALEELSALDQELELKHGIKGNPMIKARQRTQHPHATPPQGSVQGEGSFRVSQDANEPVAWAVLATGIGSITPLCHDRKEAQQLAARLSDPHAKAVPLYRHPQRPLGDPEIAVEMLKDRVAELETAIRRLAEQNATLSVQGGNVTVTLDATLTDEEREAVDFAADFLDGRRVAETLRNLLERLA